MLIEFEEKNHIYSVNGEIANISVTELLRKHDLSPSYAGASKQQLARASKRGKEIHKDLENILNEKNYKATTREGEQFEKWVAENLDCGVGEQMLAFQFQEMIIAGTADVMGFLKDGTPFIADHKTTTKFYKEAVTWQVNLLDYFARKVKVVNGKPIKWAGAQKFYCFHYDPKIFDLVVYELDKIPDVEIERLIDCEYRNEKYTRPTLIADQKLLDKFTKAEQYLAKVEETYKKAQENAKKIREEMLAIFEKQNIVSWENEKMRVSYVPPTDKVVVDSTKLKRDFPQVYAQCTKISSAKSFVRIKLKGGEEDE